MNTLKARVYYWTVDAVYRVAQKSMQGRLRHSRVLFVNMFTASILSDKQADAKRIDQNLEARAHCVLPIPLFSAPGFVPLLCQWARGAGTQVHFLAACATQSLKYADLLSEW